MKITILTIFPELFESFKKYSIIKRAIELNKVSLEIVNFREFSLDIHKKVDEYQYGGGPGMVLCLQPIVDAIKKYRTKESKVVLLTPQGKTFNQKIAIENRDINHLILICGHYEGFDKRLENYINDEWSIGDYVLTGGEIPAMVVCDSLIRLIEGVISKDSLSNESFTTNLLDYDVYTKPIDFEGHIVPKILLSGNHNEIKKFREKNMLEKTKIKRQDLLKDKMKGKENEK